MTDISKQIEWANPQKISSVAYKCGFCGSNISSERGFVAQGVKEGSGVVIGGFNPRIMICHHCTRPTFFNTDKSQHPGAMHGYEVASIDDDVIAQLYVEARRSFSACAFTATAMCCRRILMDVAVKKGAKENQSYQKYVEFLVEQKFIPAEAQKWVDQIRTEGNAANHEIALVDEPTARKVLDSIGMMLKIAFEFPAAASG